MFRGDDPDLSRTIGRAWVLARDLGHPRVGAEHLLLALAAGGDAVAELLGAHGATEDAIRAAARAAEPAGAGAAADREILATLGVDLDRMLGEAGTALLDRPPAREPLLPLGAAKARRRCARMNPRSAWTPRRPTRPRCGWPSPAASGGTAGNIWPSRSSPSTPARRGCSTGWARNRTPCSPPLPRPSRRRAVTWCWELTGALAADPALSTSSGATSAPPGAS